MKKLIALLFVIAALAANGRAATVNWAAGIDNGFSLADGTNVPAGSLVRIGYFRNASTSVQLTDAQIQALASRPATLDASFVEVGNTTVGSGYTSSYTGHFSKATNADTGSSGLNVAGKQIYVWVFNAGTLAGATQHGIFYWLNTNTATNPDSTPETPGTRWSFPIQDPPGITTIDLTDLTTGTSTLAAGAHVVVGAFPTGTSATTSAPNFGLALISTTLTITTTSPLPGGVVNAAYSQSLAAIAGTTPYAWTITSGSVPGLTLSGAGVLSGTPTTAGVFTFTAQVTDAASATDSKSLTVTIAATALAIDTASPLPQGTVLTAYSQTLAASGGTAPYVWSVSSGALPGGLALSAAGAVSGTPTTNGTYNFTAQVADNGGLITTKAFALTVVLPPLTISTASPLADGTRSAAYSQTFAAVGGATPYTWAITSGSVPGLTLTSAGVLSGTPTAAGTFAFTAQVTDSAAVSATKAFALTIAASGPLDHFTWDYVPAAANVNAPFPAHLTARDAAGLLVTSFSGSVNLTAASGSGSVASPIVITEMTDEGEDQFEIQNISNATVNTTGWFVRIGDTQTNSAAGMNTLHATTFALPASMTAGQVIRVTETSANANGTSILYFGASIGWSSIPGNGRGWIMLLDSTSAVKDFFAEGWDATTLASFSVTIGGSAKTLTGQWSGAGGVVGTRGTGADTPGITLDSFQRIGTADNNTSTNWQWTHNADSSAAMSFGTTNTGLTVPWVTTTPVTMTPTSVTLTNGEFTGYLTVTQVANTVAITATSATITGASATFNVTAALTDTDGDGIPDAWESAHGSNPALADSSLDTDGDGASNLAEYLAGTDPQSPASRLGITGESVPAAGQFAITWPGVAGKLYRLRTSPDLATWTPLTPLQLATATGAQSVTLDTGGATTLFVRVEIAP